MENCIIHRFWAQAKRRGTRITTGSWENEALQMLKMTKRPTAEILFSVFVFHLIWRPSLSFTWIQPIAGTLFYTAVDYVAYFLIHRHFQLNLSFPYFRIHPVCVDIKNEALNKRTAIIYCCLYCVFVIPELNFLNLTSHFYFFHNKIENKQTHSGI